MRSKIRYCRKCEKNILHDKKETISGHDHSIEDRILIGFCTGGFSEILGAIGMYEKWWVCQKCGNKVSR